MLEAVYARKGELTDIRRDIHANPELGFQEHRTAALVAERLFASGIEVHRGLAGTGVVGLIHGRRAGRHMVGLRADMDALPMSEENRFPHASKVPGCMHACGHDGHTAMLLGAAQYLAATRQFAGTVAVVFQPAEEFGGGARVMLEEGLLEQFPIEAIFGLHNMPGMAVGSFALSPGPVLASNSEFAIHVQGRGGHAAMPQLAVDPVPAAAHIIGALQSIVARNKSPLEAGVLTVTTVHAGDCFNVIAGHCELGGTVRAYSGATLDLIEQRMQKVVELGGSAYGAQAMLRFNRIYPATVNHPKETAFARGVLQDMVGGERLLIQQPIMAAEDFSFMLEKIPGCYGFIGNGDGLHRLPGHGPGPCLVHNSSYDFNDEILPLGASFLALAAQRWLTRHEAGAAA